MGSDAGRPLCTAASVVIKLLMQIVVDSCNLKMDGAQHREGWSGSVTDVLGVIKGCAALLSVQRSA